MLLPVAPSDHEFLYRLALEAGHSWSWAGRPVARDFFAETLWDGVLAQYLICARNGERVGLVGLYRANLFHRFAYFRLFIRGDMRAHGWPIEGAILLLNEGFVHYGLRKIYADVTGDSAIPMASALHRPFEKEGHLRDHLFIDGNLVDQMTWSVTAERWRPFAAEYLPLIAPNKGQFPPIHVDSRGAQ